MSEYKNTLKLANQESREFTKECIKIAMVEIAQKEPFDKITVSALVQRAGVSRAAFYRNYHSKEDVVAELCREILDRAKKFVLLSVSNDDYSFFFNLFSAVRRNKDNIDSLITIALLPAFQAYLNECAVCEILSLRFGDKDQYIRYAIYGAFNYLFYLYYVGGMKERAEYMATLLVKLVAEIDACSQILPATAEASDYTPKGEQQ